jgi:hypothetical protein
MNDYPHLVICTNTPLQTVVEAVVTRYAEGPFRRATDPEDAYRTVVVGKVSGDRMVVWESRGGLTPGPGRIEREIKTRDPEVHIGDRNQMWPGECPALDSTHVKLALDIDDDKNRDYFDQYVVRLPSVAARLFPLVHSECEARIEWLDGWVEVPESTTYEPGMLRYSCDLVALLAVRTGNKHWREEHVTLANFPALTPDGSFIIKGRAKRYAMDDFGRQLQNLLGSFAMPSYERKFSAVPHDQLPTLLLQDLYDAS